MTTCGHAGAALRKTGVRSRRVLWVAPKLNHYKARFLNRLAGDDLEIVVLAGKDGIDRSQPEALERKCEVISSHIDKPRFGLSPFVSAAFLRLILSRRFDVVLLPLEKKLLPLIVIAWATRPLMRFKLASYNHPLVRSGTLRATKRDVWLSRIMFSMYDRVVFYTEEARRWAVDQSLISAAKARFANNTLDTEEIWSQYGFEVNQAERGTILFIGRLIPSKRVDLLLEYYRRVKTRLPRTRLIIIGDGPDARLVREAIHRDASIVWLGAIVDEPSIAAQMRKSHIVFVPGASGLSVVHAFCYGKPYVTVLRNGHLHGPELAYLKDGQNGLLLDGNLESNVRRLVALLGQREEYERVCRAALETAQRLSIHCWTRQMKAALA